MRSMIDKIKDFFLESREVVILYEKRGRMLIETNRITLPLRTHTIPVKFQKSKIPPITINFKKPMFVKRRTYFYGYDLTHDRQLTLDGTSSAIPSSLLEKLILQRTLADLTYQKPESQFKFLLINLLVGIFLGLFGGFIIGQFIGI